MNDQKDFSWDRVLLGLEYLGVFLFDCVFWLLAVASWVWGSWIGSLFMILLGLLMHYIFCDGRLVPWERRLRRRSPDVSE